MAFPDDVRAGVFTGDIPRVLCQRPIFLVAYAVVHIRNG